MKALYTAALVLALAVGAVLAQPRAAPAAEEAGVVPGRLVVKFRVGALARSAQAAYGALSVDDRPALGAQVWRVPPGSERDVARRLSARWDVEYAEPVRLMQWLATPNDPLYESYQWNMTQINAPAAWDVTRGSPAVRVAVIDSGFDATHPDRPVNLELGCDFPAWPESLSGQRIGACPPVRQDPHGHGTHVTGIVAARWNNGRYVAGLAPDVRLLVIRSGDAHGSSSIDVADAIVAATDAGARVVNLSLGSTVDTAHVLAAVEYAVDRGVLLVAAAGNCGTANTTTCPTANPTVYPAAYSIDFPTGVIAVAAASSDGARATYSNQGAYVGIAAPGGRGTAENATEVVTDNVTSLYPVALGGAIGASGTSMAAPHVAAVAGLILSSRPDLAAADVIEILQQSAQQNVAGAYPNEELGHGVLDAAVALALAQQRVSSATQTPTATPSKTRSATRTPVPSSTATAASPQPTSNAQPPTATAQPMSATIPPSGGTLTTDNGGLSVEVPSGAFGGTVVLSYGPRPGFVVEPPIGTRRLHGFELTTSPAVQPDDELIVRIAVGDRDVAGVGPGALQLLRVVNAAGEREVQASEWVAAARQIRARVRHLGTFELVVWVRQLLPIGWR